MSSVKTPDLNTIAIVRSLSKKQRRARKQKQENKFSDKNFTEQLEKKRQAKINDLLQEITALQIIGADTSIKKAELNKIFKGIK